MNPAYLTIDVVRNELADIIARYPDRRGSIEVETYYLDEADTDLRCVYYLDENGEPISADNYEYDYEEVTEREINFVTPVCIIGQWIEDFHPEFKQDELIKSLLRTNGTVQAEMNDLPFPNDVRSLLAKTQNTQDSFMGTWKDIEL